jgi:hypothetical protein
MTEVRAQPVAEVAARRAHLAVFVGLGLGRPPLAGLVCTGVAVGVGAGGGVTVVPFVVRVAVGVGAATTLTTGVPVAVGLGVGAGAVTTGTETAAGALVRVGVGCSPAEPPPPTAHAIPAEPRTATAPRTITGAWRRGALCRPITSVFHRAGALPARDTMGR